MWLWELSLSEFRSELRRFPPVFALPFVCFKEMLELFFFVLSDLETDLIFLSVPVVFPVFVLLSAALSLFLPLAACAVFFALFEEWLFCDVFLGAFLLFWDIFDVLPPLLFEDPDGALLLSSVKK